MNKARAFNPFLCARTDNLMALITEVQVQISGYEAYYETRKRARRPADQVTYDRIIEAILCDLCAVELGADNDSIHLPLSKKTLTTDTLMYLGNIHSSSEYSRAIDKAKQAVCVRGRDRSDPAVFSLRLSLGRMCKTRSSRPTSSTLNPTISARRQPVSPRMGNRSGIPVRLFIDCS